MELMSAMAIVRGGSMVVEGEKINELLNLGVLGKIVRLDNNLKGLS